MATAHQEDEAKKKLDSAAAFDDLIEICIDELQRWPQGSTKTARKELAAFLRYAANRAAHMIIGP